MDGPGGTGARAASALLDQYQPPIGDQLVQATPHAPDLQRTGPVGKAALQQQQPHREVVLHVGQPQPPALQPQLP